MKKYKVTIGTILCLGMGLLVSGPLRAEVLEAGGGLWDFGLKYNVIFQQSQYSNYWHPNYHRSSALQDNTLIYSSGTYYYGGRYWKQHDSWSYAKTGYWYPWQWRSYYNYLTW